MLIFSNETFEEFIEVIFRPKFDKYFLDDLEKYTFIETIQSHSSYLNPTSQIKACRDKKDNKFLELAIDGNASCIITGDSDLLVLHPFQEIHLLAPQDFLSTFP